MFIASSTMDTKKGFIYILTNPSFPNYVKIGYADNVEARLRQLNSTVCTPFAFRVYATYEVPARLADKEVHSIIDSLNPLLRASEMCNGKPRVREFYAMAPEDAYKIFEAMANIHACPERLKRIPASNEEVKDAELASTIEEAIEDRRRRYWTYALDFIHETHGDTAFCNVNPAKSSWINGYVGIKGICICCVANGTGARVELYIEKENPEENKQIFDKLYAIKPDIESKLGVSLTWHRGDNNKSSKIFYQLRDVSISYEQDWPQMARFHAVWSKKFYDILIPYVKNVLM